MKIKCQKKNHPLKGGFFLGGGVMKNNRTLVKSEINIYNWQHRAPCDKFVSISSTVSKDILISEDKNQ